MKQGGVIKLENVQMEYSALKTLRSDIFLQLSHAREGQPKDVNHPASEDACQKKALIKVLKARIKSNGS